MYLYLTLLFKSPSQTNFESLKAKYPNRIFPQRIIDQFNPHKCELCNNKSKHIRSSHCSTCKVCVLKRDHHCPWVNKCIGYTNMQFFFTYLIWLMIYGVLFFQGFLKYYNNKKSTLWVLKPFVLFCALFTFVVFIAMINLLVQTFISFVNECFFYETTKTQNIERYYICCKQMNMEEMTLNPYNKGWLFNIECCIGPTLLHFLFPIRKQYKSDINEGDVTFCKAAQSNQYDVIKALSGIKYDTIDKIIENQSIQTSPNTYMEYARAQYSNIKII